MWSAKYIHSSIIGLFLVSLTACTDHNDISTDFPAINLKKTPLYHYTIVGSLIEAPVNYPEAWNREALKQLGIRHIVIHSKGGKNPEDTLMQFRFDYSNDWKKLAYSDCKNDKQLKLITEGTITYRSEQSSGEIVFSQFFGVKKAMKTRIQQTDDGFLLLRSKSQQRYDTTWVIGSFSHPKVIVSKIGNSIFSVELFMPEGSSSKQITQALESIPMLKNGFQAAQCSVVFMQHNKPQSAFLLNETNSQVAKIKEWTYKGDQILTYKEWLGNSVVRDMSWHYTDSQLPDYAVIDRNTYFYRYEK
ncbi:MAG: hypothetical protein QE487_06435 [Fluviicola sp.]|nr:hypothetical protein [Fluviicola sp.]